MINYTDDKFIGNITLKMKTEMFPSKVGNNIRISAFITDNHHCTGSFNHSDWTFIINKIYLRLKWRIISLIFTDNMLYTDNPK